MTKEEKAKRYDETLERAKRMFSEKELNYLFPELKESEDERIKRTILELVSIAGNGNQFEEIKDWLEKQGEQKPTDKVEPKTLDPDKVIEYLKTKVYDDSAYGKAMIERFKKDFGL